MGAAGLPDELLQLGVLHEQAGDYIHGAHNASYVSTDGTPDSYIIYLPVRQTIQG